MPSKLKLALILGTIVVAVAVDIWGIYSGINRFHSSSHQVLLIWSVGCLIPTVLLASLIAYLLKHEWPLFAQTICLAAVVANLILIFSACPMDLREEFKPFANGVPGVDPESTALKFLVEEHKKAVEEIKNRDLEEDGWFHNKFILVGGLLAATLGYIGFGRTGGTESDSPEQRLTSISKSPSTAIILALATVLALGVDMHVRGNACEVDQLGIWINYFVEPLLLHSNPGCATVKGADPIIEEPAFLGWEEFLRTTVSPENSSSIWGPDRETDKSKAFKNRGAGLHSGELWNLVYEPHIHFLTAFVYLLYLIVFQRFAQCSKSTTSPSDERTLALACFAIVHISFSAFTWIAHSGPEMFEFKVLPFTHVFESGSIVVVYYFLPCLALIILNAPYVAYYLRVRPSDSVA